MKLLLLTVLFSSYTFAAECPWLKIQGSDMMAFDSDLSIDKALSSTEVESDLKCLKILFKNFYIAQKIYGETALISKIDKEIKSPKPMSSRNLMNRIFTLHKGMTDIHLAYTLANKETRFELLNKRSVSLSEDPDLDVIYDKGRAFYFRPGSLINFSSAQRSFIEVIGKTDKDLIIDLRGNGGGDDDFAYALAESLFTKDQKIPKTKRLQLHSPLQRIGFSLSLLMFGYESAEAYRAEVRNEVSTLQFQDLLPYKITEEVEALNGKRPTSFNSKITLLIDGECASSCETIVEKISAHPNAKVIGTNTAGALHFSNAMTFMLPHSGIVVRLPTLLHLYEKDAPEGVGYSPDQELTHIDLNSLLR